MDKRAAVRRIRDALAEGELSHGDLTARALGEFLGKTSSVVYHHWSSLDGLLFAVAESGFELLRRRMTEQTGDDSLEVLAETFVEFGLDCPDLYALMFERHYDWGQLRRTGDFDGDRPSRSIWDVFALKLEDRAVDRPDREARILLAGLHGLVSLASTGRFDVGNLDAAGREFALASARRLVRRATPDRRRASPTVADDGDGDLVEHILDDGNDPRT